MLEIHICGELGRCYLVVEEFLLFEKKETRFNEWRMLRNVKRTNRTIRKIFGNAIILPKYDSTLKNDNISINHSILTLIKFTHILKGKILFIYRGEEMHYIKY